MGITIHHKIALQKKYAIGALDEAERIAGIIKKEQAGKIGIPFEVRRLSPRDLLIDIGGCETLCFELKEAKEYLRERGYNALEDFCSFEKAHTGEHYERYPDQKLLWTVGFCKTQFSRNAIEHKWVADLIRVVAGRAALANVYDEGGYYHTGTLEDAREAIAENGALIRAIGKKLDDAGFEKISGGETVIKPTKKNK